MAAGDTKFCTTQSSTFFSQLLPEGHKGFYRFAKLVESIAQGLHDGRIKAPTVN